MEHLPPELIEKILDPFPKKSLLRFRCVSKLWRRLINSRLNRAWRLYLFPMVSSHLYCVDLCPWGNPVEIKNPLEWVRFVLLGSCYHFICISNCNDGQLAIWNVATGTYEILPPADAEIPNNLCVYGFGLRDDEFVLLRVDQTLRGPIESVSIYTKTAHTWRQLQKLPYFLLKPVKMGVFLHGRLYWIMRCEGVQNSEKVLVAFDIFKESFVKVDLPKNINNRLNMDLSILRGCLTGCLCLTIYDMSEVVDLWILKGYQWIRPWDLLFSLRDHYWSRSGFQSVRPFFYDSDGHQVLVQVSSTAFCWYNLHTRAIMPFHIKGVPTSFKAATCLQLLPKDCQPI